MGIEKSSEYYNEFFANGNASDVHYKISHYWVHWTQVIKFIGQSNKDIKILEIGCGTGQLAEFLKDERYYNYVGFDFSKKAVDMAKSRVPDYDFFVSDALDQDSYKHDYDLAICLEVLEHIEEDLNVLKNIKEDATVIFSVPDFPAPSHVRRFLSHRAVKKRYYRLVDIGSIIKIGSIFIVRGKRSDFSPNLFQRFLKTRENVTILSFIKRIKHKLNNFF